MVDVKQNHFNIMFICTQSAGDERIHDYLQTHVARPRDVELITGLQLLRGVRDVGNQLLLKTRLYVGLWDRTSWMDDQQCPKLDAAAWCVGLCGQLQVVLPIKQKTLCNVSERFSMATYYGQTLYNV